MAVSGTLSVVQGAAAAIGGWNAIQGARAAISAAGAASNPLMWPNLALALGTAAATAGTVAVIMSSTVIKADLGTAEGRASAVSQTMQAIA